MAIPAGRFDGQVAIVTGATRGIGLAIAQRLVDEGGRVVITGRKSAGITQAVAQLGADRCLGVAGASDDTEHQDDVLAQALTTFGRLDVLVNNTGVNPHFGTVLDMPEDAKRKTADVNIFGTLSWITKAYQVHMHRHGGAIVNVASVAGILPAGGIGFYGVTKAAVIQLTRQLAVELAPSVRVNAVAPAVIRTRFAEALFAGKEAQVAADYPLGRLGEPEDVAAAVAFLASADAGWMTGQTLTVDGGLTLGGGV